MITPHHSRSSSLQLLMSVSLITLLLGSPTSAGSADTSARSFVSRMYFHGIPYDEAKALGPEALPELEGMLADSAMKPNWGRIVGTIAYIGTPQSFRILKSFMWSRFKGPVDNETWMALIAVPNVLCAIPDSREAPVIDFLEKGTNPAHWDSLPWSVPERYGRRSITLSEVSINGLGCTGSPRAASILAQLKARPYTRSQVPNIEEGLKVNAEIQAKGLAAYVARMQHEMAAPRRQEGSR